MGMNDFAANCRNMTTSRGASDDAIEELRTKARVSLPDDYLAFLRWSNGAEGEIGPNYLRISSAEDVAEDPYPFADYVPGLLFIGSDGGEALFAFDTRSDPMPIVITHTDDLDGMLVQLGASFSDFLDVMARIDWIETWAAKRAESRED